MDCSSIVVGDIFNETDDDAVQQITEIRNTNQTVMCRPQKEEDESTETETEYDIEYVKKCVKTRKQWIAKGYDHLDVYAIYRMDKKTLISVLELVKQSTKGNMEELRDRLISFNKVVEIPSDVDDDPPELIPLSDSSNEESHSDFDFDSSDGKGNDSRSGKKRKAQASAKRNQKKSFNQQKDIVDDELPPPDSDTDTDEDADEDSDYSPVPQKKPRAAKHHTRSRKKSAESSTAAVSAFQKSGDTLARQKNKLAKARARVRKKNGGKNKHITRALPRAARRTNVSKGKKVRKHQAEWKKEELPVAPVARHLPEHAWRHGLPRRSNFTTPWNTWRKVFFTDEMVAFALEEFNHYPKTLASMRTRPPYIPKEREWPPKWVSEKGRCGPMQLNKEQYLKYICILYLLGAKNLNNTSLDDLFSTNPIMRENWLCEVTTRRDLGRFLRQVRP